jgi:carbamoyltransferase
VYILGINSYHGDTSATLLKDGQIVAAVEEERFNRIKHTSAFPTNAIKYCLRVAGIGPEDLDHVGIGRNPSTNLHKKILFALSRRPDFSMVSGELARTVKVRNLKQELATALGIDPSRLRARFHNIEHHLAHCASTFLVSGFDEAAILSVDGFGDFTSTMYAVGRDTETTPLGRVCFPDSLGIFYTAVTQYCGFLKYGDEGKLMGLAPYGRPVYLDDLRDVVRFDSGGRFDLNLEYFVHHSQNVYMNWDGAVPRQGIVYSPKFVERFGPQRERYSEITEHYANMAASAQTLLEEGVFHCLWHLQKVTGSKKLCLAGGVALNGVANGKILLETPFTDIFIQPAAGDAGLSLGAALYIYHCILGHPRSFVMTHAYTGPEYSNEDILKVLQQYSLPFEEYDDETIARKAAELITQRNVLGWFQGMMEFGPRALGNRSIVVDPRWLEMKDILNSRIKHRESFRPFAPSILEEAVGEYFEQSYLDPFMLKVYNIKPEKRAVIPAVTHVDGTGRLQTVSREANPRYWRLIKEFENLTGVPVVLNTSFNENEPIVNSPAEAAECFLRTKMDCLVMGNCLTRKGTI